MKSKKPWHMGTYHVRSRQVRQAAYASPLTRCWRCGLTLLEVQQKYPRRRVRWTAGHLNTSQTDGPLAPECSPCNYGHGAAHGNAQRRPRQRQRIVRTRLTW